MEKRKKITLGGFNTNEKFVGNVDKNIKPTVVDFPGFKGTLPFQVGKTLNKKAHEVPDGIKAEEDRIANAPIITSEEIKKTAIQPPQVVDFDDLTEDKKKEIKQAIVDVTNTKSSFMPAHPSIGSAMKLATKVARETQERQQKEVKPESQKTKLSAPVVEQPTIIETAEEHKHVVEDAGATNVQEKCKHCGWPVGTSDPTDPTPNDKQNFVASLLGQKRFTKSYSLLGGKLNVVFRTLTVRENDDVIKQLVKDWNDGKISGPAHSVAEATKYQMILGLDSIDNSVGSVALPEYEDYESMSVKDNGTILPDVVAYVYDNALKTEPMRRIIAKAYGHFIDTVTKLEAMAESPDFWQAIGD